MIDRSQMRAYEALTPTLHDAFAEAARRGHRGARAREGTPQPHKARKAAAKQRR